MQKARLRLIDQCANLPSEGLLVEEFITEDTHKTVWVIHVPRHMKRQPVYAHNKAWQRLDDSLIELTDSRRNALQKRFVIQIIPKISRPKQVYEQ